MSNPDDRQTVQAAAKIITDAMLQAGMDPAVAIDHPSSAASSNAGCEGSGRRTKSSTPATIC